MIAIGVRQYYMIDTRLISIILTYLVNYRTVGIRVSSINDMKRVFSLVRVDVNTRMVQSILHNPDVAARLSPEHYRALSPLIYLYINHYGRFEIDPLIQIDL